MNSARTFTLGTAFSVLGLVTVLAAQQPAASKPAPAPASTPSAPNPAAASADNNALVQKYCVGCHNDRNKDRAGSLTLTSFDIAKAGQHADVAERMIRKL